MSTVNIPITGDATSLVAATQKANAALNTIGVAADNASKKIAPAMSSLSGGAQKAAAALGPLGGVLSKISPDAGAAASSIAGLSSAATGLGAAFTAAGGGAAVLEVALGPVGLAFAAVAVAVAGLVTIYGSMQEAAKQVEVDNELVNKSLEKTKVIADQLTAAELKLNNFRTGASKQEQAAQEVRGKFAADFAEQLTRENALKEVLAGMEARRENKSLGALGEKYKETRKTYRHLHESTEQARADSEAGLKATQDLMDAEDKRTKAEKEAAAAKAKAATDAASQSAAYKAETARQHAEYMEMDKERVAKARAQIDQINAAVKATENLTDAVAAQGMSEWERAAAAGAARDSDLRKQITINQALNLDTKKLEEARVANHAATAAELAAIDAKRHADEKKLAEESSKEKEDAAKVQKDRALDLANFMVEQASAGLTALAEGFEKAQQTANDTAEQLINQLIAGDQMYTKSQKAELVKRIAEQRAAAKEAFAVAKAARLAEAVITTAMAVINAYNSGVALPIGGAVLGPAMAIAAGVTGAISIATIAAEQPSFHSGKSPDEMQATILKKEAVLNTTAAANMGRGRIEQMNNGMSGANVGGPAPIVLGHRVFEAGLKRSLDSAGVLREALNAGAVYGHRTNRRISSV
jgi:hypothetical protein